MAHATCVEIASAGFRPTPMVQIIQAGWERDEQVPVAPVGLHSSDFELLWIIQRSSGRKHMRSSRNCTSEAANDQDSSWIANV